MPKSENIEQKIADSIQKITSFMKLDCRIEIKEESSVSGTSVFVSVYTPENAKLIIGKNGQNLRALEHIVRITNFKDCNDINLVVDVNDYRKSKANQLVEIAQNAVARVRSTQKPEALTPMTAYERRVVHMELASYPDVTTESIGEEPQRRIVIKPYSI